MKVLDLVAYRARRDAELAELAGLKGYAGTEVDTFARAWLDAGATPQQIHRALAAAKKAST